MKIYGICVGTAEACEEHQELLSDGSKQTVYHVQCAIQADAGQYEVELIFEKKQSPGTF